MYLSLPSAGEAKSKLMEVEVGKDMMTSFICNEFYIRGCARWVVIIYLTSFKCKKKKEDKCQVVFAKSANIFEFVSVVFGLTSTIFVYIRLPNLLRFGKRRVD